MFEVTKRPTHLFMFLHLFMLFYLKDNSLFHLFFNLKSRLMMFVFKVKFVFEIYSIQKESKYTAVYLLINNETKCAPLPWLSSRFITYTPSFVLDNFSLEQTSLNLQSVTKIVDLHSCPIIQFWLQVLLVIPGHYCPA